ncbi:small-conductance mechanosensitive channel [Owenweeksia hongkongensis DSM 17368]|uniref:Small-conductance mechanosensitive channel n=1 Tax=Owenweeksia hongkongensis (strain DSM 17368 / CIP 108786 / JCM 12287 / NRRL B-23963 / UST20020801) TaxID=926562 RepID=G8R304_OWEHD|nr:mechanosensitive ion channel family protein [Owenweeksia hongkongensis]AEV32998.1 small-conductance mechanosensitive channel [Owenweeksia hongkongensis DSM 17368]
MNAIDQIKASVLDYWDSFLQHVPKLILGLIILVLAIMISRWLSSLFQNRLSKRLDDQLLSLFLTKILRMALIVLSVLLAFNVMGFTGIAAGLLAGAGVGALVIGFAFQDIGANFIAGVILAFNRPFSIGDTIEIAGVMGKVLSLNLRTTHVKTFDGKDVFIPNNTIVKEELVNYTKDGFIRLSFIVGIDYEDSVEKAVETIIAATLEHKQVLQYEGKKPMVIIKDLGVSTVNLEVRFWVETFDYKDGTGAIRSHVIASVLKNLTSSGVGLPADIVELKYYKGEGFPIKLTNAPNKESKT